MIWSQAKKTRDSFQEAKRRADLKLKEVGMTDSDIAALRKRHDKFMLLPYGTLSIMLLILIETGVRALVPSAPKLLALAVVGVTFLSLILYSLVATRRKRWHRDRMSYLLYSALVQVIHSRSDQSDLPRKDIGLLLMEASNLARDRLARSIPKVLRELQDDDRRARRLAGLLKRIAEDATSANGAAAGTEGRIAKLVPCFADELSWHRLDFAEYKPLPRS